MKEQSYEILKYIRENSNVTAIQVAENFGLSKRMVDAIFSSAIVRQELGYREETGEKTFLRLTSDGFKYTQ